MRYLGLVLCLLLCAGCDDHSNKASSQTPQNTGPSREELENAAEAAFSKIDQARENYPPLGGDPSQYNAGIAVAYHAWERTAEVAYGKGWRPIWEQKHGIVDGADLVCARAARDGMPQDACYQAFKDGAKITPLDNYLMKCPSWDDPTGAIFNPHDQASCDRRAQMIKDEKQSAKNAQSEDKNEQLAANAAASAEDPSNKGVSDFRNSDDNAHSEPLGGRTGLYYITGLDPNGDNWLALRSEPSGETGFRITKLGPNELLTKLEEQSGWIKVKTSAGLIGWASEKYLTCCKPSP